MSYVTKQKQENTMKRVSFALILVLLSFGLSYGLDITADLTAGSWDDLGTTKINTDVDVTVSFTASYTSGDETRLAWSSPFVFYGTGGITTLAGGAGTFVNDAAFDAYWDMSLFNPSNNASTLESWDGDLTNNAGGLTGDLFNFTGVDFNAPHLPTSGSDHCFDITFTAPFPAGVSGTGDFCVAQGDFVNDTYDWLFDPPAPVFATYCWAVELQPDVPPVFDNCTGDTQIGQYSDAFGVDLDATDPDATAGGITFEMVSGPGAVDPATGMWTWQPVCGDVGSHTVVICASDANNACPTGNECSFAVQVNNTAPVIAGDCGDVVVVGTGSSKIANFSATDVNGGLLTFSVESVVPAFTEGGSSATITQAGVLTFTADLNEVETDYVVTVRVTDCNGDFDECTITFTVLGELPFDIVIEKVEEQEQGHHGYVNVTKEAGSEEMWGFDFLIGYDNSALTFIEATQGAGIGDWEYFTYRYNWNGNCGNACPSGLLRVTSFADENDGPNHPAPGYGDVTDGDTLFVLDFLVTNDYNYQGQFVPIYFYWMDCGDNTIAMHKKAAADPLEVLTAMAMEVYWYNGVDPALYGGYLLQNPPSGMEFFPTYYGVDALGNEGCLDCMDPQNELKCPVQFIRFFGGGIDIIPVALLDDRGDVNLNGVPNEIADAVVFTNYFIYGPSAFTINYEGQKAATEVNGDGIALTVADLVYLIRVVVGDALPLPAFKPVPTTLHVTSGDVNVDNAIGAGYFVFAGNVDVTLAEGANGMELLTNYRDGQTHAILYSLEKGATANGHILNSNGDLVSVEAATYEGASFKDVKVMPTSFAVKSYPNPFNPVATVEMSLPSASDWTITVFNVVGQRVADFNGHSDAGLVKVQWDASNEASGIYFYKVDAGKYSVTKKMVLLK